MAENSIPQVGCSEGCPIAPYIEEAFTDELTRIDNTFKQAKEADKLRQQAQHESDGAYEDFGDLNLAEFERDYSGRMLRAKALDYHEQSTGCDGIHCKLAGFLVKKAVEPRDTL